MQKWLPTMLKATKPAALNALRFYFYMVIVFFPIGLAMYWPENLSFSVHNLLAFTKAFVIHPLPWLNLGILFCIFLLIEITGKTKNAV
jgi:hypothetical protein